jgi:hypothetical protein
MIGGSRSTQKNVTAGKNLAGRDVNSYDFSRHAAARTDPARLRSLLSKAAKELATDERYSECVNGLQRYLIEPPDERRDLRGKLSDAGREKEVRKALELKEHFVKMLNKHVFSESAQLVYAHLLGKIETVFDHKVQPLMTGEGSELPANHAIAEEIVEPLADEVGAGNVLEIGHPEIRGMIYFLTGNCHLEWAA